MTEPASQHPDWTELDVAIRDALTNRARSADDHFDDARTKALRDLIRHRISVSERSAADDGGDTVELGPVALTPTEAERHRRSRRFRAAGGALLAAAAIAGVVVGVHLTTDPTVSTGPASVGSSTPGPPSGPTGTIAGPRDGDPVGQCAIVYGTADVPAGDTIVLAYQYLNDPSLPEWYFQLIRGSESDRYNAHWGGTQFFGSSGAKNRNFVLVALAMDRAQATADSAASSQQDGFWHSPTLPEGAIELDRVNLVGTGVTASPACSDYDDRDPGENPTPTASS